MSEPRRILGLDEDRARQAPIAQALNEAGFHYRFIADRKGLLPGLRKLKPGLLIVHAEVRSPLVEEVLLLLAEDVELGKLPIALLCRNTTDAPFVTGLRTGIVAVWELQASPAQCVERVRRLLEELPSRSGTVVGQGDSRQLALLIEHLRRTRRSGEVTLDVRPPGRPPRTGRAAFVHGQLESARYLGLSGVEALVTMVAEPKASWKFTEVGGAAGEGAGVVIAVGDGPEDPLGDLTVTIELEPDPPPAPEGLALLLVDDDPALCKMFRVLFERHGFEVDVAKDGVEGLEAALGRRYDAVIADLNMPRMDGWGLLRMLREDYRTRELPVAFLSCHDDYRDSLRALEVGAQAYFSKGTRLDALVEKVRKLVRPRSEARERIAARAGTLPVAEVGPQWLILELSRQRVTAKLEARDPFAEYELHFAAGRPVHAFARSGRFDADGLRALNAFLASTAREGQLSWGEAPTPRTLEGDPEALLARACEALNESQLRLKESLLVSASKIDVNEELYRLYSQVGPAGWLEVAQLLCVERLPPREVIAKLDVSPIDLEDAMRDLLRRGVLSLS